MVCKAYSISYLALYRTNLLNPTIEYYQSECGPQTSSVGITWKLVKNAESQVPSVNY